MSAAHPENRGADDVGALRAAILDQARGEAERIESRAREEAEEIVADARSEAERQGSEAVEAAEDRAARLRRQAVLTARAETREALLRARADALAELATRAEKRVRELGASARYRDALGRLVSRAVEALGVERATVELAPQDVESLKQDELEAEARDSLDREVKLEIRAAERVDGGVRVSAGSRAVDHTLSARLARCREQLWPELAGALAEASGGSDAQREQADRASTAGAKGHE